MLYFLKKYKLQPAGACIGAEMPVKGLEVARGS